MYYSRSENDKNEKECLSLHLARASALSKEFAADFGEADAGYLCGVLHDAGKASRKFQNVLNHTECGINHESAGAYFSVKFDNSYLLARVIFAHHKGIMWDIKSDLEESVKNKGSFESRKEGRRFSVSGREEYQEAYNFLMNNVDVPKKKPYIMPDYKSFYSHLPKMLHTRMLLSCLVDADYTSSAMHYCENIVEESTASALNASELLQNLETYKQNISKKSNADEGINAVRNSVYNSCLKAAENSPGLFTLTAPTGTGKTLALLAFAARHAEIYKKKRIIIVLPYLSIINQNAGIYREICDDVLEAHSAVTYDEQTRLYAERWTSPLIVTTSVKFFEALFHSKPADLRFLHSIANSVVVFDEAQSIPNELVGTTVEAVNALCEMFRCTVVFSTATQPAFEKRKDISYSPTEIIADSDRLYQATKRVNVIWNIETPVSLEHIAAEMSQMNSVCCVVNRKDHAHKLFSLLKDNCDDDACFHLSTDMCKAHTKKVIDEITKRLYAHKPCRLVSTSCIEAGVDLDFERMYRALAPLDSIIQCAGRCNRNGRGDGKMVVFIPDEEKLYPSDDYQNCANCVKVISCRHEIDINNPEHIKEYYSELFQLFQKDKRKLCNAIEDYDFEEVEKQYRFIPSKDANVLVPYEGKLALFEELAKEATTRGITKSWIKRAAPITVTSYRTDKLEEICEKSAPLRTADGIYTSLDGWYILNDNQFYDDFMGLHFDDDSSLNYLI